MELIEKERCIQRERKSINELYFDLQMIFQRRITLLTNQRIK